mmetsp:Transcript_11736/g.47388  ORF Transcript_11736/g.47388 Transcript_11736/m.47388 type:complete len:273 (-) Transcript_11736:2524-3342(-)
MWCTRCSKAAEERPARAKADTSSLLAERWPAGRGSFVLALLSLLCSFFLSFSLSSMSFSISERRELPVAKCVVCGRSLVAFFLLLLPPRLSFSFLSFLSRLFSFLAPFLSLSFSVEEEAPSSPAASLSLSSSSLSFLFFAFFSAFLFFSFSFSVTLFASHSSPSRSPFATTTHTSALADLPACSLLSALDLSLEVALCPEASDLPLASGLFFTRVFLPFSAVSSPTSSGRMLTPGTEADFSSAPGEEGVTAKVGTDWRMSSRLGVRLLRSQG